MKRKLILTVVLFLVALGSATGQIAQANKGSNLPPHYKGWICIHNHEAGWHQGSYAKDGNGVSKYWGGLQMSYNWLGVIPGRASDLPPIAQMWAAELKAEQYNFSYSFMSGQWPNTFPPCAAYFNE